MSEFADSNQTEHEENTPEKQRITVEMEGNHLLVDGRVLNANDDPDVIRSALTLGRPVILAGLEEFKRRQQELNPGAAVSLAPFEVIKLARRNKQDVIKSLTKEALESNQGVYYDRSALREEHQPLWDIVESAGFAPQIKLFRDGRWWLLEIWGSVTDADDAQETPDLSSLEAFDRSKYPDWLGCYVMPEFEEGKAEVQIYDAEGNTRSFTVPNGAVRRMNIPQIVQKMKEDTPVRSIKVTGGKLVVNERDVVPQKVIKAFENDLATGIVSCRIVENLDDLGLTTIELPDAGGVDRAITVPKNRIAKRR